MICKNCKHWTRNKEVENLHGEILVDSLFGKCSHESFTYTGCDQITTPVNGLSYWDYEGYQAGFETGAEFGCIHYSTRLVWTQEYELKAVE